MEFDNSQFINREISQLKFNERVLKQATDQRHPLLERLKFLLIFSSNLDEFFEVRVAKLKLQILYGRESFGPDGLAPRAVLRLLSQQCHQLIEQQYHILNQQLLPELASEGISFLRREHWNKAQRAWIKEYFEQEVAPIVSPIALDPAHPFPRLSNKSLNFFVTLKGKDAFGRDSRLAIVPAPRSLPRLIQLPKSEESEPDHFVFLSAVIHEYIDSFFHGMKATGCYQFRVTRNSDIEYDEKASDDLAAELRGKLFSRRYGHAVRIEVVNDCPESLANVLLEQFDLTQDDLYYCDGPVNLQRLFSVFDMLEARDNLKYAEFSPERPTDFEPPKNLIETVKSNDYLLYHPYSSFNPVLDFLREAANDPLVTSIKQTLYRVGHDSEIVDILDLAARNGKEVTVVIELRARFDEKDNLALASRLQEAGAVVCYGVVGYKTHAKMMLILRKDEKGYSQFVHLGTGNYHARNARVYTDYSLFSADPELCQDIHKIFQQLTGMGKTLPMKYLFNSPFTMKKKVLGLIEDEIKSAEQGKPARMILKVNGLTERAIIEKLYKASRANVKVDLIVRGMCVLRPGVKGISDNITVKSIVGRFLEHNRAFYFQNSEHQVYCASADLMDRNLSKRIEICFPVLAKKLAKRVLADLELFVADKGQSWFLNADGEYQLDDDYYDSPQVQMILLDKHCESAVNEPQSKVKP